ncbi:MAG TPA: alpha/beta hydrolase [Stellaceae bacterium]|nr:alpha/beta hydrolase [Stellaceae bacterium]
MAAPALAEKSFTADDGVALPLRVWRPAGTPKAVLLALHGFNDYSNAFAAPAEEWAKHGIATYAYDQRGFGQAPERGRWLGARRLAEDVTNASAALRARYPGVPLYLLGESMGGAVAIVAVTGAAGSAPPDVDGIILAAPAVWGRETMNVFERAALWTGNVLFPGMTLTGGGLHITPSDNIAMLRALSRDPLVIKETRVDTIKGLVDLMDLALDAAPRVTQPMLLLYGSRDEIVPRAPTQLWVARLPYGARTSRRIAWYASGYHMLLRDLEAGIVLRDIESWIADRDAPLPSHADQRASVVLFASDLAAPVQTISDSAQAHTLAR